MGKALRAVVAVIIAAVVAGLVSFIGGFRSWARGGGAASIRSQNTPIATDKRSPF
jgi:hypothetical protein